MNSTKPIRSPWLLAFCLFAFASVGSRAIGQQATRDKFEKVAAHLEFFDLHPFLYNRAELDFTPADAGAKTRYFQLLNVLLDPHIPVAEIIPLRRHPNPKVRTLALAALFHRNDPHLLPLIAKLAGDTAPTFPGYTALSQGWLAVTGIGPPPQKQTAGGIAESMVNFYLERAGYNYGLAGSGGKAGFADYWAKRQKRSFCASWFAVKLARAGRATSPTQPQYRAGIFALRKQIDALPAADRDWTLLYLNGEDGSDALAAEHELIEAAKRRGPDALLSLLREHIPSADPDLQHRDSNDWSYGRLMQWILANAPQLLRPDMASDLLECERWQRDYQKRNETNPFITAAWPVAAAKLQPQRGREILKAAWPRFAGKYEGDDRVSLMAALAALGDARDYDFVSAWFFSPSPAKYDGTVNEGKQSEFFRRLPHQGISQATHQFAARLIGEKRFDAAKFWAVKESAELVNAWLPAPAIDIQKLFEVGWHGDENDPKAFAAIASARAALRQIAAKLTQQHP